MKRIKEKKQWRMSSVKQEEKEPYQTQWCETKLKSRESNTKWRCL